MRASSSIYAYLEKPSMVDFPGRLAAVFFTSGCGFRCGFCHNASLMGHRQEGLTLAALEEAVGAFRADWVNGAVITGGEPTEAEDLLDLIRLFKEQYGFAVKLDTNGSNPERLSKCLPLVDYVAMDIKCAPSAYAELTGFCDIDRIAESVNLIRRTAADYEFRTTIVETVHTDEQLQEIRGFIAGARRYVMQAFVPREDLPDERFRRLRRTTSARLHELKALMEGCAEEVLLRGA